MRVKLKRTGLGCVAVLVIVGVALAGFFFWYHQNHIRHARLRLNMTRVQVEQLFGRPADCEAAIGCATVLIFLDPAHSSANQACSFRRARYETPRELPWCYSAVQVALSCKGRVSAFAHVGESLVTGEGTEAKAATLAEVTLAALEK